MARKGKFSPDEKIAIVQECLQGESSVKAVATRYKIDEKTLKEWRFHYQTEGHTWFVPTRNRSYSSELKYLAVHEYLSGNYTQHEIMARHGIKHKTQLKTWISMYNGHNTLKSSGNGGTSVMTKGRKTTWKERIDITMYCISHDHDYAGTSHRYQVSYQQVYQWVKKYNDGGEDALKDGRGRKKAEEELTDTDKQKLAIRKLEYENERLKAEVALLKKLRQLRGE